MSLESDFWLRLTIVLLAISFASPASGAFEEKIPKSDALESLETLYIDISSEHFQKIKAKRKEALKTQILLSDPSDFVPAKLSFQEKKYKANIRLKGDWTDHMDKETKWSFRIKVRKGKTILGMRKFSIQAPATRSYLGEWVFHHVLKSQGLIGLRYLFINVVINGRPWGKYAVEEHFDRILVESNQHREGVILAFDENPYWEENVNWGKYRSSIGTVHNIETMEIKVFNQNRIRKNPDLEKHYRIAVDLLGKWRAEKIPVSQALAIDKWGLFFALSDLLGAPHAVSETNMRFYYNPVTKLLEPVGFDSQAGSRLADLVGIPLLDRQGSFSLHEKYLAALEKVSDPSFMKSFTKELSGSLDKIKTEAQLNFQEPIIEENAQIIRNLINPAKGLRAYFYEQSAGYLVLQMSNFLRFPIQVESITLSGRALIDPQNLPLIPPKGYTGISLKSYRIKLPPDLKWSDSMKNSLEVNYRMLGSTRLNKDKVLLSNFPDADRLTRIFESDLSNYKAFDFLVADHHAKQIIFAPGKWIIGKNLIIPKGFTVFCGPGTELDLVNGANIISFSPMHFMGSVDEPILIHSSNSTGQGFILSGSKSPSYFKHVKFENLMSPHKDLWENQGAITAYDSDVTFLNSYFTGNRGQTGLMVLQSTFQIIKTAFEKNKFDALTVELSNGNLESVFFTESGRNALSFISSESGLTRINIQGAGEKGLVIKDHSLVNAWSGSPLIIRNTHTAVSCADLSQSSLQQLVIENNSIGLENIKEKKGYEPCKLCFSISSMKQTKLPYLPGQNGHMMGKGKAKNINTENSEGTTPLIQAIQLGDLDIVRKVLKLGADPNQSTKKGLTPLREGTKTKDLPIIRTLLENGATAGLSNPNILLDFKIAVSRGNLPPEHKIFPEAIPTAKKKVMPVKEIVKSQPVLVEENFEHFNIVLLNGVYYGVSLFEGPLDLGDSKSEPSYPLISAPTVKAVKARIKNRMNKGGKDYPSMAQGNYKYFTIIKYKNMYYGIDHREDSISPARIKSIAKYPYVTHESLEEVRSEIDTLFKSQPLKRQLGWQLLKIKNTLASLREKS